MAGGEAEAIELLRPACETLVAPGGFAHTGPVGSGHFVKMIHNGIEYGDMQLISEAYWVMKNLLQLNNEEMSSVFST